MPDMRTIRKTTASSFPSRIEIFRPQEEYDITLNILKLEINKPLRDDQFALEQPRGADVVHLDQPQPQSSAAARPSSGYEKPALTAVGAHDQ